MSTKLSPEDIARSHRWHAIECNNLAWELSCLPKRSPIQDEEMLNAAHASAFHWAQVGTELNHARAKMLLGQVYAVLEQGNTALHYAQQSYDYLTTHEPPDWEIAFAHAILAHAAFATRDHRLHQQHYAKAKELGAAIKDSEDREIFFKTFNTIPSA
jgi:hypothetical protein